MKQATKANTSPLVILALLAALVAMSWLYVGERSKDKRADQQSNATGATGFPLEISHYMAKGISWARHCAGKICRHGQ